MIARRAGRVLGAAALACAALMAAVPPPDASQSPPPASGAAISVLPLPRRLTLLGAGWCGERFRTYEVRFEGVPSEPGALELLEQRWGAIGVTPRPGASVRIDVSKLRPDEAALSRDLGDEGYLVVIDRHGVRISAATAAGRFYGMMTLAQLPQRRRGRGWCLPDARVVDWPAMRWRGLSDDLSRGPIPTLAFLKERIRAIAAFKGNLYSLYLESAFRDPQEPLASPQDAITPRELADLAAYAARYHVALMPEQETLGHMHRLLSYERYAGLAELPHDYVLAPAVPGAEQLMQGIVDDEGAAVRGRTPFFHLGGDEPNLVGSGRSADLAKRVGPEAMYLGYYTPLFAAVAAMGMRPVVWGDFLLAHAGAIAKLPKSVVVANWHYAAEASYIKYLEPFAKAGVEQLVAPGANNWGEIYPNITAAKADAANFVRDGQATPGVIGMLDTVWHDDGESLFSSTWYPVLFALTAAWQPAPIDGRAYDQRFAWAFFGTTDPHLMDDIQGLRAAQDDLLTKPTDPSDYQFWADPFRVRQRLAKEVDVVKLRGDAERVLQDLETHPAPPPLHADALQAMRVAAMRYDFLGRKLEIAREFDAYYADALQAAGKDDARVFHDLFLARYLLWEWRDDLTAIRAAYAQAWGVECRPAYLPNVLSRYDEWRTKVLRMEDRLQVVTRERYYREGHALPARAALFAGIDAGNETP